MNVTSFDKRDFADMVKFRIMRWGDYSGLCSWALNIIINVFIKGRIQRLDYRKGEYYVITQEEIGMMCFEDGVRAKCKEYR